MRERERKRKVTERDRREKRRGREGTREGGGGREREVKKGEKRQERGESRNTLSLLSAGDADKEGESSQYTSSMESSDVQSYPPAHLRAVLSSSVDTPSRASLLNQLSPLESYSSSVSEGRVSLDSTVILETKSSSQRNSSSSLGASPRGLFNRSQ